MAEGENYSSDYKVPNLDHKLKDIDGEFLNTTINTDTLSRILQEFKIEIDRYE